MKTSPNTGKGEDRCLGIVLAVMRSIIYRPQAYFLHPSQGLVKCLYDRFLYHI